MGIIKLPFYKSHGSINSSILITTCIFEIFFTSGIGFHLNYVALLLVCLAGLPILLSSNIKNIFPISLIFICIFVSLIFKDININGEFLNFIFWILLSPVVMHICKNIDNQKLQNIFLISTKFGLFIMILDTILRFSFPTPPEETINFINQSNNSIEFYNYKFGGFMFSESNSLGLAALALYFSLRIISNLRGLNMLRAIAAVLVALSLSRAAFLGLFLFELIWLSPLKNKYIKFRFYIIFCLMINFILFLIKDFNFDGSLGSKNEFLNIFFEYIVLSDLATFLFGIGIGQSEEYFGVYLHNFFILILSQLGIIGGIAVLWILHRLLSGNYKTPVLLAYSTIGLSYLFMLGAPVLFIPIIIASTIRTNHDSNVSNIFFNEIELK